MTLNIEEIKLKDIIIETYASKAKGFPYGRNLRERQKTTDYILSWFEKFNSIQVDLYKHQSFRSDKHE
jgi:hypothetical protein